MESTGITGEVEAFSYPLFQTLGMFVGMVAALAMHFLVLVFKIPFPGYDHSETKEELPTWMYFFLIIPALFDLVASALCMFGLRYVDVSIYQMLRGAAIVFVALLKQFYLGDKLKKFMWVGVMWNVVSICLVGATAMLAGGEDPDSANSNAMFGVFLILCGALVQSLQYAFEEKVMSMDVPAPPLLLIGMEGFWGALVCVLVLYPLAYYIPGPDHGCIENPFNTYEMIMNSKEIQFVFVLYFFSIFFYNMLACLVTYMLNSVWHAILDNFRPVTVWAIDLFIFYCVTTKLGEKWTVFSWMQLLGMFVLLYGTAIYNAPNPGSFLLNGGALSFYLDFTHEYAEIEDMEEDLRLEQEAEASRIAASGGRAPVAPASPYRRMSPLLGNSPLRSNSFVAARGGRVQPSAGGAATELTPLNGAGGNNYV